MFSEPERVSGWVPPKCAGLYAIVVSDSNWAPKAYQPLYFGEFGHNSPIGALSGNQHALAAAANGKTLFVCAYLMPFSTSAQRWAARNELIWAYNPICQADGDSSSHRDQAHMLKEIPEAAKLPRRPIGFMPQCEPAQ
jgi:hypothetical protein